MIRFRASSLWEIMGDPKTGTGLSVTAQTSLDAMAKEAVYGFTDIVDSKEMRKGIDREPDSIDLLNAVKFARYEKNTERKKNDFISGECDIYTPEHVRDVKTAWSLKTFPATIERVQEIAKKSGYDWQGRAYMALWDVEEFWLDYCMVSTPEELRRYEPAELHEVDHIAPHLRVTSAMYKRDLSLEQKMWDKVGLAREYLEKAMTKIRHDHE
jgi:hypothetical protein